LSQIENTGRLRQREPRIRDKRHLGLVARLPCLACLIRRGARVQPVHVAHIRAQYPEEGWREVGKAEKPSDFRTAPLCPRCHLNGPEAQHRGNERDWWERLAVYPPAFCAALVAAFGRGESGGRVVEEFADRARRTCAARESGL
jgi:hypothetical protein